jgi:hypothetical protein
MLKGIEEGVTALDAFKVKSASKPDGLLPSIYATFGFEEVAEVPFDPKYFDDQQLADLKAVWKRQGWNEADGYPSVAIMKWKGDDAIRPEATRRFILESQEGLGIGSGTDVAGLEASQSRLPDGTVAGNQSDGRTGQGDGRADPGRYGDRARSVSGRARSFVENILAADQRAIKALKLPQELIDRVREEYGAGEPERTGPQSLGQEVAPRQLDAMGFYSAAQEAALRVPDGIWQMGWQAARNSLAKGKDGVVPRKREIEYLGLDAMFSDTKLKGAELKALVLEHIEAKKLSLVENFARVDYNAKPPSKAAMLDQMDDDNLANMIGVSEVWIAEGQGRIYAFELDGANEFHTGLWVKEISWEIPDDPLKRHDISIRRYQLQRLLDGGKHEVIATGPIGNLTGIAGHPSVQLFQQGAAPKHVA